jgi:hypothetical protein
MLSEGPGRMEFARGKVVIGNSKNRNIVRRFTGMQRSPSAAMLYIYERTCPHASAHSGDTARGKLDHTIWKAKLTDRRLRTRIYKCFHRMTIDFHIDIQHVDISERLWLIPVSCLSSQCQLFSSLSTPWRAAYSPGRPPSEWLLQSSSEPGQNQFLRPILSSLSTDLNIVWVRIQQLCLISYQ